jgi:hypothetical protein
MNIIRWAAIGTLALTLTLHSQAQTPCGSDSTVGSSAPKSAETASTLQRSLLASSASPDTAKTLDIADRLLAIDPCNIYAYVFEVYQRGATAATLVDPAAKLAAYNSAAEFAKKGLTVTKPKDVSQADFDGLKKQAFPTFYGAIGADDLQNKNNTDAIKAFKDELNFAPLEQTMKPGPQLQDTYSLATAYYTAATPDYPNCAYYAGRAMNYAPEPFRTSFKQLARYCYVKYHGADDGFDDMVAVAATNLNPPATFSIRPASPSADTATNPIATTPASGPTLALVSGPTMVETISFISTKMSEQSGVPVAFVHLYDGRREDLPVAQAINSVDSCTAHVSVHIPYFFHFYQEDLNLSFANIDPRDVHLLALSDWRRTIEPSPALIPGNVKSQTDHNIYDNMMEGHVDPDLYIVTDGDQQYSTPFLGVFSDKRIADRVATAYIHAFSLCHKAEAF